MLCAALIAVIGYGQWTRSDAHARRSVIKLVNDSLGGECSAEQVQAPSGNLYVLSAGHCKPLVKPDSTVTAVDEAGRKHEIRVLAEDPAADLLLFEGIQGIPALKIADHVYKSEHVRAFTHGNMFDTYKMEGELIQDMVTNIPIREIRDKADEAECTKLPKYALQWIQVFIFPVEVCSLSVQETVSTLLLVPGSSGGEIVNDAGELVGVASAVQGPFSYLVSLDSIKSFLKNR